MRAALGSSVLSPAAPLAALPRAPGTRSAIGLLFALALVPLALYGRVLFYPALEVSDGGLATLQHGGPAPEASAIPARLLALGLHAGATLLAFGLARRLGAARGASLFLALLFAVHPLRVEAVAWLSQHGVLLGGFFFLAGACLSLGQRDWRWPVGRALLLLALLAEPRLLLGVPWLPWVEHRLLGRAPTMPRLVLDGVLLCLAGALLVAQPADELAPEAPGFLARLVHAPFALGALAWQACLPVGLTPHHPHPAAAGPSVAAWMLAASWVAFALFLFGLRRLHTRRPRGALAALLFVLLAAPEVLFPRAAELFRESSGYVALLGLELVLAGAVQAFAARAARPAYALGALLVLALAARTVARLSDWSCEPALQESALFVRAEPRAHDALGQWHLLHGRLGPAQREHERALELARRQRGGKGDARAWLHLGELELRRALIPGQEHHLGQAAQILEECLADFPGWTRANEVLGEVYQRGEEDERALRCFEAAAEYSTSARTHTRLGLLRRKLSDPEGARAAYTRATELDPRSADAWCGLGIVRCQQDELDGARLALERALALEPEHVEARATLARLQDLRGEHAQAEHNLRRALGVNPDHVDGLYALGMLLSASARGDEALRYLDRVCEQPRNPPHVRAHLESARLRMARGEHEVPRQRLRAVLAFNPEQAEAHALLARLPADGSAR